MKEYRFDLDVLKGIAIIAVVLYHLELLSTGYLGVDVFFVINGFLIVPSIIRKIDEGTFSYFSFLWKRVMRLLPVLVIACYFCFLMSYWGMLPNDLDKLCASIVATELFSNNLLSLHSIKDYWDTWNNFKPLMHTWYLGILFEFYLGFPLVMLIIKYIQRKTNNNFNKCAFFFILIVAILSLLLYISNIMDYGYKFYLLPCRLYEILGGGLIGMIFHNHQNTKGQLGNVALLACLMLLFLGIIERTPSTSAIGNMSSEQSFLVTYRIYVVIFTVLSSLLLLSKNSFLSYKSQFNIALSWLGKMSFSIFVWHQIIIAFYRYYYSTSLTILSFMVYLLVLGFVSYWSYKKIESLDTKRKRISISIIVAAILIMIPSVWVYLKGGIVRDIPELGLYEKDAIKGQNLLYCDRICNYDKDFSSDGNVVKVLVVGNSFARDFANILLESSKGQNIELSYSREICSSECDNRTKKCDYLFCFYHKEDVPQMIWNSIKNPDRIYGIGTKNYGDSNGHIYTKRFWLNQKDYYSQTIKLPMAYIDLNKKLHKSWGDHYIDLIEIIRKLDGTIPVFTPDGMFISQDCRHLTPAGAKYYASILKLPF